jgi:hypothetical protein
MHHSKESEGSDLSCEACIKPFPIMLGVHDHGQLPRFSAKLLNTRWIRRFWCGWLSRILVHLFTPSKYVLVQVSGYGFTKVLLVI